MTDPDSIEQMIHRGFADEGLSGEEIVEKLRRIRGISVDWRRRTVLYRGRPVDPLRYPRIYAVLGCGEALVGKLLRKQGVRVERVDITGSYTTCVEIRLSYRSREVVIDYITEPWRSNKAAAVYVVKAAGYGVSVVYTSKENMTVENAPERIGRTVDRMVSETGKYMEILRVVKDGSTGVDEVTALIEDTGGEQMVRYSILVTRRYRTGYGEVVVFGFRDRPLREASSIKLATDFMPAVRDKGSVATDSMAFGEEVPLVRTVFNELPKGSFIYNLEDGSIVYEQRITLPEAVTIDLESAFSNILGTINAVLRSYGIGKGVYEFSLEAVRRNLEKMVEGMGADELSLVAYLMGVADAALPGDGNYMDYRLKMKRIQALLFSILMEKGLVKRVRRALKNIDRTVERLIRRKKLAGMGVEVVLNGKYLSDYIPQDYISSMIRRYVNSVYTYTRTRMERREVLDEISRVLDTLMEVGSEGGKKGTESPTHRIQQRLTK